HDEEEEEHEGEDEDHDEEQEEHEGEDEDHDEEQEEHEEEGEHHDDEEEEDHEEEGEHHDEEEEDHEEEGEHHDDEDGDHEDEEEGGVRTEMEQTRYDFVAALDDPFPGLSRIKLRWGFNDYQHNEIEPSGEVGTAFDNEEVEGRVEFIHNPVGDWNGVVGFHYRHKEFSAVGAESYVLPSTLESFGIFMLEKTDIGRVHIDLGARFEYQDSSAETGAQNDYDLFSASGGINWDYAPGYQLGLSVSHSERAPSIEELYAQGPHLATSTFEIGDANLDKEKSNNIDVYWRKTTGRFTVTANFFYNRIDDYVYKQEQDLNGDGFADRVADNFDGNPANILDPEDDGEPLLVYLSQDDAEFLGFEMETVAHVLDTNLGRMDLRLWADYVEGERSNDTNLARITPWRFGSGLTYSRGPLYASVKYTRVNKQDDTAPLETETAGYDLLDLHAGYTFRLQDNTVTLFARATNLLDEEIRRHTSFVKEQAPLPGRSGIFGLRVSF
ncbi:MAG: TonB-dependent receptor, partial [Gammaproteobacteria bacterium]|nr:TonB-dependent receptor [Gammaproteobacteria bacterium]